jgi:hypothetical protein
VGAVERWLAEQAQAQRGHEGIDQVAIGG